MLKIAERPKQK